MAVYISAAEVKMGQLRARYVGSLVVVDVAVHGVDDQCGR